MPMMIHGRNQRSLICLLAIALTAGLVLIQSNIQPTGALAGENNNLVARTATPTRTATPITFNFGYGGCRAREKVVLTLQARANVNPSTNFVCGRLVIVKDHKTGNDVLILEPCEKGSYYIFKIRPDELHNYYQFMNVQFMNGEKIYTEEFGVLSKYIKTFTGYYILENCQGCGIKPVFISTAEVIFPTSTYAIDQATVFPTLPPFPTQAEILPSLTPSPTPRESTTSPIPASISPTFTTQSSVSTTQTVVPTSAIYLTLMDLKSEPEEPFQNQEVKLHIAIQNLGFPTGKQAWNYSVKVVLTDSDGKVLEESEFARDQTSSIQVVKSTRVQAETWEITIPMRFKQPVKNGELEVFIKPLDYLTYIYPRSVKIPISIRSEATPTATTMPSTSQVVMKPTAIPTEPLQSQPSFCTGLNAALLIPMVGVLFLRKRKRNIK